MRRIFSPLLTGLLLFTLAGAKAADAPPAQQKQGLSLQDAEKILVMADQGDAAAQNYLGFLYATGQGVAKDEKMAFRWFQKAADQSHPEAIGNLAVMHEKGLGVTKNPQMALTLHRQAAMAGYPLSMKRLAALYETGPEENRDLAKAEMWKNRYKEAQGADAPAAGGNAPRQTAEKSPASTPSEKSSAAKPVVPAVSLAASPLQDAPPVVKRSAAGKPPAVGKSSAPEKPAATEKPIIAEKPPVTEKPTVTEKPPVAEQPAAEKPTATASSAAVEGAVAPASATPPTITKGDTRDGETPRRETSGKRSAQEAVELIQKIVEKDLLPKDMRIEMISTDADNYHIRIGHFPAPQKTKAKASASGAATPEQERAPKKSAPAAPPREPEVARPVSAPAPAPAPASASASASPALAAKDSAAPTASEPPQKPAEKKAVTRGARGNHYYFVRVSAKSTFEDALTLAEFLFTKEFVRETRRVKIENLDGNNFEVSVGPFSNAKEADEQSQKIGQRSLFQPSIATFEKRSSGSAEEGDGQPFVQINTQGALDHAVATTRTLMKKDFFAPSQVVEIVNFGAGNYRVRLGPYKGMREAHQGIQGLKKELDISSPILLNLDRLVPVEGR